MAKNIQELRREAGYRSAKDFAAAMGIALSTYNRYENQPDAIPLKQAWAIADFLGCSIDMVVGREPVSAEGMRGDVQKFYDGLSDHGREMMDGYMEFVSFKEAEEAKAQREEDERKYAVLLDYYEGMFSKALSDDACYMDRVMFVKRPDIRGSFMEFMQSELGRQRDGMAVRFAKEVILQRKKSGSYPKELEGAEAEAYYQQVYHEGELLWDEANGSIEEVTGRIMEAFDRVHRGKKNVRLQRMMPQAAIEYMGH